MADDFIEPAFAKLKSELMVEAWKNTPNGRKACRRIKDRRMEAAMAALPALIQRVPMGHSIDALETVKNCLALSNAMVLGFVEEKLI